MTKKDQAKAEARRTAREQRRTVERQAATRQRRKQLFTWAAAALAIVAVIALVVAFNLRRPGPGERIRAVGPAHIAQGSRGSGYNSNPPTSGPHWPSPAPWGVHAEPLPDEVLVHNLEHGGVWISYKDAKDTDLADKLVEVAGRYRTKVIVTPRPKNDAPIAVAGWGRLLKLQRFDEARIVEFINAYRGKLGPERGAQ